MSGYLKMPTHGSMPQRVALTQAVLALCPAALALVTLGGVAAYSALLAGGISALCTWYAGRKVFGSKARGTREFVRNLYLAQAMKLALAAALFCIAFSLGPLNFPVFITTYAATLTVYGFALAALKTDAEISGGRGNLNQLS